MPETFKTQKEMVKEMKVQIITREIIKPSFPTPSHLKTFKLSLLDQLQPVIYIPLVYFYPENDVISSEQISQKLKKSLSEALARFYPIAGRIDNNTIIECTDEGAQYFEARFNCLLSTFLEQPADPTVLQRFIPAVMESLEAGMWPLLLVQATFFDCGGFALGISMSHKFADPTTMGIFMKSWAETSNGSGQKVVPVLTAASYFPPSEVLSNQWTSGVELKKVEGITITKRYVFDKSKILELKAETADDDVQRPTRVEVVTALIWKCVMAASKSNSEGLKRFALAQSVNMRKRVDPPLPEYLIGNIAAYFVAETHNYEQDQPAVVLQLQDLVGLLRKGIRDYTENVGKRLGGEEASKVIHQEMIGKMELFRRGDTKVLFFTSLCNFELYEAVDFGWGKPIWVTIPDSTGHSNVVTLMDTKTGGIEAWVTLTKEDMALFERDPQLLEFAYLS